MIQERIDWFFTPIGILNYTKNSEATQKAYSECLPLLSEYGTDLMQNEALYAVIKTIYGNENATLNQEQRKVLEDEIEGFELEGCGLPREKKERVKAINIRLSDLENQFSQNLLDATNAYELILKDPEDVKGMPASELAQAKEEQDGETLWRFTLQMPSYFAYMTYGPNRIHREAMYKAYSTRAPENGKLIEEILALRDEKAKLLGYEDYAAMSVKPKMAESPTQVEAFLEGLLDKALPQAQQDVRELKAFAAKEGFEGELASYDVGYYAKKLEEAAFDLDEEAYRPYFEKNSVVRGLFDFLGKLFCISFTPVKDVPVWDETVLVYT